MEKLGWEQGTGLGKNRDGVTEAMKVKQLKEGQGLGASKERTSNSWMVNVTGYAGVLAKLNKKFEAPKKDSSSNGIPMEVMVKEEVKEEKLISRNSIRYGKRAKHKDMRSYSVEDLTAIMGGSIPPPAVIDEKKESEDLIGGMFVKSTKGDLKNLEVEDSLIGDMFVKAKIEEQKNVKEKNMEDVEEKSLEGDSVSEKVEEKKKEKKEKKSKKGKKKKKKKTKCKKRGRDESN